MTLFHIKLVPFLLFILLLGMTVPAISQNRVTEEQVQTEKVFIDASREKIMGNYENAAYLFKEVLKRDKKNHAAAYELARVYDVLDKTDKSIGSIKMAVAWDPNPWYKMFLADMYDKSGKHKDSAKIYSNLVDTDPNNEYYYTKWAFSLVKAGNPEKAIKVYNSLEKKVGPRDDITRKKYTLYLGMGKPEKAIQEYKNLIKAFPSNVDNYHALAEFYTQLGQNENARNTYQEILKIDPQDGLASFALADAFKAEGNDANYLNSLKPIFEKEELDIDLKVKELIPFIQKIADSEDKSLAPVALELAHILEIQHPKEAKSYSVSGDLLYHSGKNAEALEKYKQALNLDKSIFSIFEQVMYIDLELNDYEDLMMTSNEAIDLFPNHAKGFYFNGLAHSYQNNPQKAINSFEQSLIMSRKQARLRFEILFRLGGEYHKLKKYPRSDKNYEEALKLNPKNYNLLNTYSYHLAVRGEQLEKAKEMSALANELRPNHPEYQDTYGWILYKMKEYKAAKEWVGRAISETEENVPSILEHYGDILFQLGDEEKAIQQWQKALEKGAKSDLLEKKISDRQLYE